MSARPKLTLVQPVPSASDSPRLVLYRGKWTVYYKRKRVSAGEAGRAQAERFLADFIAALAAPPASAADTVTDMLAAYLANRQERGKPGAERMKWSHKQLRRLIGSKDPSRLSEPDFVAYTQTRLAEGVGDATVRTELTALRAALRWRLGTTAPKVAMPDKPDPRDRWLTRDEAELLLAACERRHLRLFVQLGLNTAARSHAILELTWDRVDLERRRIDYRQPGERRSKKRRVPVPINDTLLAALVEAKERATTPYVIEWAGDKVASVKHGITSATRRAGLVGVTPHVLRHTAATWMLQGGVSLWDVAGMLGHSDTRMVESTYGHHAEGYLKAAAKSLETRQ